MNATDQILLLDKTLSLHNEGEWSDTDSLYDAFNDAGVECEVGEFLYSLVRLMKPNNVLETGTHWGISTSYMGLALKANNRQRPFGDLPTVDTVEFLPEIYKRALIRFTTIGISAFINANLIDAAKFQPREHYQLMLLDTEPQTRFAELVRFFPSLDDGGIVLIHDLHRHMQQDIINPDHPDQPGWPYGPIPEEMRQFVTEGKLRPVHFSTPRGLTMFYKVHPEDYKWQKK